MKTEKRIASFVETGARLANYATDPLLSEAARIANEENPWFTPDFIRYSLLSWSELLEPRALTNWLAHYRERLTVEKTPKTIGVVMAGNIPMVGFHDMLCVLMSGNRLVAKLSQNDRRLLPAIAEILKAIDPGWEEVIRFTEGRLEGFDGVIATGSNNTSRYFEYYFGKYPHIIRKNRNSAAVLTGDETENELRDLALDVFLYFGLGCRSVSKIFFPGGYDPGMLDEPFSRFNSFFNHHKYRNNYDYHRSVAMLNGTSYHDGGFYMMVPSAELASPVAVVNYEYYSNISEVTARLEADRELLQCAVGPVNVPGCNVLPGNAQHPGLADYADDIDTMAFLTEKI